jgi:hypothetical protein
MFGLSLLVIGTDIEPEIAGQREQALHQLPVKVEDGASGPGLDPAFPGRPVTHVR